MSEESTYEEAQLAIRATIRGHLYDVIAVNRICEQYGLVPDEVHQAVRDYIRLQMNIKRNLS